MPKVRYTITLKLWHSTIGCSKSGLGKAAVERLIQKDSKVVICDLPASKGKDLAANFSDNKAICAPVNVISEDDVNNALSLTKEKFGRLDNVVNCAVKIKKTTK